MAATVKSSDKLERIPLLEIGNATLRYRNFEGKQKTYNKEGDRNFCVVLDEETSNELRAAGWNVRWQKPRPGEENDPRVGLLEVAVSYKIRPPRVLLIAGKKQTLLTQETVKMVDWADIVKADVVIRPRLWQDDAGKSRIKAYLQTLYVTIVTDSFAESYDTAGQSPIVPEDD